LTNRQHHFCSHCTDVKLRSLAASSNPLAQAVWRQWNTDSGQWRIQKFVLVGWGGKRESGVVHPAGVQGKSPRPLRSGGEVPRSCGINVMSKAFHLRSKKFFLSPLGEGGGNRPHRPRMDPSLSVKRLRVFVYLCRELATVF